MNSIIPFRILAIIWMVAVACNNSSQKDAENYMNQIEKTMKENSSSNTPETPNSNSGGVGIPSDLKKIVGEWELVKIIGDTNGNRQLDADEEKDVITNMKDYLKLNANGTCEYTIYKLEGRFEIVSNENGRKKLVIYDHSGTETSRGRYIISVTEKELVINRISGGSDFEIFKRL